jgi:hypothetical protein
MSVEPSVKLSIGRVHACQILEELMAGFEALDKGLKVEKNMY